MLSIFLAATAALLVGVSGHSFLIHPVPDWTDSKQPECRVGKPEGPQFAYLKYMQCHGPCGGTGKDENGVVFFSETHGHTTLARGQRLYMKWTRNNHQGGFVRFTLVPKNKRMDKEAHSKFAFRYACWEAGEIACEQGTNCGTDEKGLRYQTEVEIPHVFPNGEYVLGWSWYGGTQYARNNNGAGGAQMSEFGDYWSCANIKIDGSYGSDGQWKAGNHYHQDYTPVFIPGMNDRSLTKCFSAVDRLGVCWREPCKIQDSNGHDTSNRHKGEWRVPEGFDNGNSPSPIRSSDIIATMNGAKATESLSQPLEASVITKKPEQTSSGFKILRFELVNTRSGDVIPFNFESSIDVSSFRYKFSVRAIVSDSSQVQKLEFSIEDAILKAEYFAPYYVAGDNSGKAYPWASTQIPLPLNKDFTLTASATLKDGSKSEGLHKTFRFTTS